MPGETSLVAIKARNTGGPFGIKGFFAAGRLVTGSTWKCTHVEAPNWNMPSFDDTTWPAAKVVQYGGQQSRFRGVAVTGHDSKWIWAAAPSANVAFCRGFIRKIPAVATADTGLDNSQDGASTAATQVAGNTAVATGSQDQGNKIVQNSAGNSIGENNVADGNVAGDDVVPGSNVAEASVAQNNVAPKVQKKPTRGRFHAAETKLAGGKVGIKQPKAKGNRVFRKNNQNRVHNNAVNTMDRGNSDAIINVA